MGSDNVYFETPTDIVMQYPCIIYSVDRVKAMRADNTAYIKKRSYQVISITKNPDTDIIEDMLDFFEYCYYERRYKSDNLIHDVFTVYF